MRTNLALINIIILGIHIFSLNVTNAGKDCEYPSREESYYSPVQSTWPGMLGFAF